MASMHIRRIRRGGVSFPVELWLARGRGEEREGARRGPWTEELARRMRVHAAAVAWCRDRKLRQAIHGTVAPACLSRPCHVASRSVPCSGGVALSAGTRAAFFCRGASSDVIYFSVLLFCVEFVSLQEHARPFDP
ncbi:hypothetical protein HPB50_015707 [Hyalomma asiaticum]|uniref:Uncharacterized protein n=1 Tax=Hyalomma asiaticum TaxID=266040 RepID=A0ACB7SWQ6_HYAAI|nr:hypothetical protein HPB50_015707 [Hyalomma asiaticum]